MLMDHTDSDVSDGYYGNVGWITTVSKIKVMRMVIGDGDDKNGDDEMDADENKRWRGG
jgi:hypothetical protein